MPITELLDRNSEQYGSDVCLVEINPEIKEVRRVTWKEYELIEPNPVTHYRREITWSVFEEKAIRFANMLISRGVKNRNLVIFLDSSGYKHIGKQICQYAYIQRSQEK